MLRFERVDATLCELIAGIIGKSFGAQAELLGIDRQRYPHFVAFETAEGVRGRMNRGDQVILAYLREKVVGTVSCKVAPDQPGVGYIKRLAVLPEFRGKMYGCQLMRHAETMLGEYGVARIELSIVARFHGLRRYYESLGYVSGEIRSFPSLPFEVLFMQKVLSLRGGHE